MGANATEAKHSVRSKEFMRYDTGIISSYVFKATPACACAILKAPFIPVGANLRILPGASSA